MNRAYKGCDFVVFFTKFYDALGQEMDLTGGSLACSARFGGAPPDVAAPDCAIDPVTGTARATFPGSLTDGWVAGTTGSVDGVLHLPGSATYFAGRADFTVIEPITPAP